MPAASASEAGATAILKHKDGSDAGQITFTEATGGLLLKLDLKGFKPGAHAIHVHETGKCEGDFASAGAIYNPFGAEHGLLNENGPMAGDLPNVNAAADGTIIGELLSPALNFNKDGDEGLLDSDGAAIVIFDAPDDHMIDPDTIGNARAACGVIKAK